MASNGAAIGHTRARGLSVTRSSLMVFVFPSECCQVAFQLNRGLQDRPRVTRSPRVHKRVFVRLVFFASLASLNSMSSGSRIESILNAPNQCDTGIANSIHDYPISNRQLNSIPKSRTPFQTQCRMPLKLVVLSQQIKRLKKAPSLIKPINAIS